MKVEIRGVNFVNKGAELMLHAALSELRSWDPPVQPVLGFGQGNAAGARALGLPLLALLRKKWIDFRVPAGLWPPALEARTGLVPEGRVDVVLEASGYNFGDPWGPRPTEALLAFARRWKRGTRRLVLLPQALGPFETPRLARAFARLAAHCDRIYARDPVSLAHARAVVGPRTALQLAPDFTNLCPGRLAPQHRALAGAVAVVPNLKMITWQQAGQGEAYRALLLALCRRLVELQQPAYLLVHDRGGDLGLARELNRQLPRALPIVDEADPLAIKGLLGVSRLVLSSRFHGLVSALSQGVPVLATGWSHKYGMLLDDYGCAELLLDDLGDHAGALRRLEQLVAEPTRAPVAARIAAAAATQQQRARAMWDELRQLLQGGAPR